LGDVQHLRRARQTSGSVDRPDGSEMPELDVHYAAAFITVLNIMNLFHIGKYETSCQTLGDQ